MKKMATYITLGLGLVLLTLNHIEILLSNPSFTSLTLPFLPNIHFLSIEGDQASAAVSELLLPSIFDTLINLL